MSQLDDIYAALDSVDRELKVVRARLASLTPPPFDQGITIYSQLDPRWASVPFGPGYTIKTKGCLITSMASAITDAGRTITPGELCDWLRNNGGFLSGGEFIFGSVDPLGAVKFSDLSQYYTRAVPKDVLDKIALTLVAGGYVMAMVDWNPGTPTVDQHWVRITAITDDRKNAECVDPMQSPGGENPIQLAPRYGPPNDKTVAGAVYRLAFYERVVKPS